MKFKGITPSKWHFVSDWADNGTGSPYLLTDYILTPPSKHIKNLDLSIVSECSTRDQGGAMEADSSKEVESRNKDKGIG
ncbi:putative calcium-binding protein isoform X1 [Gossypium australe]|uniref:Putative calcium-binding protein isoform X1 n=1 Tax=Gossypium australe TaxID=47621 RepID=A0A5B6V695_9ROSI|nr:putative calcium-binding protein isoform X1 [Gossypium australe]